MLYGSTTAKISPFRRLVLLLFFPVEGCLPTVEELLTFPGPPPVSAAPEEETDDVVVSTTSDCNSDNAVWRLAHAFVAISGGILLAVLLLFLDSGNLRRRQSVVWVRRL